jgi:hypothetical protein
MIATTIFGGLGNQMFIYAMVRAMALRNNTEMAFNLNNGFATDHQFHRFLELGHFNLYLPQHTIATFNYNSFGRIIRNISRKIGRNLLSPSYLMVKENQELHFEKDIANLKHKNIYLEGYWQSMKYFKDCEATIRNDFQIRTQIPHDVDTELQKLQKHNRPLVMIGIRRYQECTQKSYLTEHLCNKQYFDKGIEYMRQHLNNPLFVAFSQDREWVKKNLSYDDVILVKKKDGELSTISDIYLMTHCQHAIISNSSFYWWGAWLQENKNNHLVIAPNNFINADSVCDNWIKLPV